jgi:hypothetical protein
LGSNGHGLEFGDSIGSLGSNGYGLEFGDLSQDLSNYDYLTQPVISLLDSYHDITGLPW